MAEPTGTTVGTTAAANQSQQQERTFTQAELDAIIGDRLTRQRQQYSDYDALKSQATKWAEHEEAQKTELQKEKDARVKAENEKQDALRRAEDTLKRSAFIAEAAKLGVAHPEDAYALADKTGVKLDGDKVTGADVAVKALVDAGRLPVTNKPQPAHLDGGAGGGDKPPKGAVRLTPDEEQMARKMGVSPEAYAKRKAETPQFTRLEHEK